MKTIATISIPQILDLVEELTAGVNTPQELLEVLGAKNLEDKNVKRYGDYMFNLVEDVRLARTRGHLSERTVEVVE